MRLRIVSASDGFITGYDSFHKSSAALMYLTASGRLRRRNSAWRFAVESPASWFRRQEHCPDLVIVKGHEQCSA